MSGLGIRKASEVAVPAYLSSVCATSTGVEAMASNIYLVKTTLSWNRVWPKRMGFITMGNKIQQIKKGPDYFHLQENIQIGCSVHQLDRPNIV